jgi:formate dehydrogenase subunit gamma
MGTHPQPWSEDIAGQIVARHAKRDGALLPILHDLQAAFGFIPDAAVALVAAALNVSRADVHGVVTFYHDFRTAPAIRPIVKLCRAEACQARGVEALAARAERRADVAVEAVYCLGLCASGPAAMVGDRVFARLDGVAFDRLLDESAA